MMEDVGLPLLAFCAFKKNHGEVEGLLEFHLKRRKWWICPINCKQMILQANKTAVIKNEKNRERIEDVLQLEETAEKLKDIELADIFTQRAHNLWDEIIDADPLYGKTALMISSYLKDTKTLEVFFTKYDGTADLYYNFTDFRGKTAFIYACQESGDIENWK